MPVGSLGGEGIFTAILVALFATELIHFLQKRNIGFKLPEQETPKIRQSFDLPIPIIAIFITLFPLSLWVQAQFGLLLPQAIMALFAPIISASDSLPAVLLCHMLWFAGILQAFWLTNLGLNQQALDAGKPITHVFIEPFWQFLLSAAPVLHGSAARRKEWPRADALLSEASEAVKAAHRIQTELIGADEGCSKIPVNLIMEHAQDHLMSAMLCRELAAD